MADVNPPDSSVTGLPKADPAETTTAPNEVAKTPAVNEEVTALRKRVGDLSGLLSGVQKTQVQILAQLQAGKPKEEPNVLAEIEKQREELRQFKEQAQAEKREAAIQAAIASHGIDTDNADLLYDHITVRHADKFKIEGNRVYVEDLASGDQQTVKDFIGALLKSSKGDKFKSAAAQATPTRPLRTSNAPAAGRVPYHELPKEDRQKMSDEERRNYVRAEVGR